MVLRNMGKYRFGFMMMRRSFDIGIFIVYASGKILRHWSS